jgi:hypothetical protein
MSHVQSGTTARRMVRLAMTACAVPALILVPAAASAATVSQPNKAQTEYAERSNASHPNKAQAEYAERSNASHPNKAQAEYAERTAPRNQPPATTSHPVQLPSGSDPVAWQLALSAAAGSALTVLAMAGARRVGNRRRTAVA